MIKGYFLSFCILLASCCSVFSQTSLDEYDYVNEQLMDFLDRGQEIKPGYSLIELAKRQEGQHRSLAVYGLVKNENAKTVANILRYRNISSQLDKIICIPDSESNEAVLQLFVADYRRFYNSLTSKDERDFINESILQLYFNLSKASL